MATKAEILADPNSRFNQAPDDAECFPLLGVDALAPAALRRYAKAMLRHGCSNEVFTELQAIAKRMDHDGRQLLKLTLE